MSTQASKKSRDRLVAVPLVMLLRLAGVIPPSVKGSTEQGQKRRTWKITTSLVRLASVYGSSSQPMMVDQGFALSTLLLFMSHIKGMYGR